MGISMILRPQRCILLLSEERQNRVIRALHVRTRVVVRRLASAVMGLITVGQTTAYQTVMLQLCVVVIVKADLSNVA